MDNDIYEAPKAELSISSSSLLSKIPASEIIVTFRRSKRIRVVQGIWFALFVILILSSVILLYECYRELGASCNVMTAAPSMLMAGLYLICSIACYKRTEVAYFVLMVFLILHLFLFPLGTIVGIYGLSGLVKGKNLFGSDKIEHNELKNYINETY